MTDHLSRSRRASPTARARPRDIVERAERAMLDVAHDDRQKDFRSIDEVLHVELEKLHKLSQDGTAVTGTPTGFKDLDELTGGFQPGNLIIIAARPAMGKSCAGHQHRRERRRSTPSARRALLARDVRDRARAALHRLAGRGSSGDELRKGRVGGEPLAEDRGGELQSSPRRRCSSTTPRDIGLLDIRAKARRLHQREHRRAGADHRRLPPAHAGRRRASRTASSRSAR